LYKTKEVPKVAESHGDYTKRIMLWVLQTAQLVYLVRGETDSWVLPTKETV